MNDYEEKQECRKDRYTNLSFKAATDSAVTLNKARTMLSAIPMGQPILVDHYSAGRDRRFRARIHDTFGKGFALSEKAEHYARKAEAVGTGGISSDDPQAIEKLRAEKENLEKSQAVMKAANKVVRSKKTVEVKLAELVALGLSESQAAEIMKPDYLGRVGFATYQLSNNNSNIHRIADRIAELEKRRQHATVEHKGKSYTYREDTEENRVMFIFEGKPAADVISVLKRNAFKWSPSRGAWVRQLTNSGIYAGGVVRQFLDK